LTAADEQGTFDEFANAELQLLLRLAWSLTGNDHDAWDLVQDSLARMRAKWSTIERGGQPQAYARRVLVNLNLNRLRRLRRELLTPTPSDHVREETGGTVAGWPTWLYEALEALPSRQRTVITLAYLEDMPVARIAETLGCSQSAVKTHLTRARKSLRTAAPVEHKSNLTLRTRP
jgi:RNA polymerase sigma-70 factor (sigma-E family)